MSPLAKSKSVRHIFDDKRMERKMQALGHREPRSFPGPTTHEIVVIYM